MRAPSDGGATPRLRELLVVGLLALLVTGAAVAAFFGPGVLSGRELFFTHDLVASDFWHLNYPFRHFYAEGLREGRLPLWCPDLGFGDPSSPTTRSAPSTHRTCSSTGSSRFPSRSTGRF